MRFPLFCLNSSLHEQELIDHLENDGIAIACINSFRLHCIECHSHQSCHLSDNADSCNKTQTAFEEDPYYGMA